MTQPTQSPQSLRQLWQAILAVSDVAVGIHYAAPWSDMAPAPKSDRRAAAPAARTKMAAASA